MEAAAQGWDVGLDHAFASGEERALAEAYRKMSPPRLHSGAKVLGRAGGR